MSRIPHPTTPRPAAKFSVTEAPESGIRLGTGTHVAFTASLEFFLAPIMPFMLDAEVNEIMVTAFDRIYIEKAGLLQLTTARFGSEMDVQAAANNMAQFVWHESCACVNDNVHGKVRDGMCKVIPPRLAFDKK